MIKKILAEHYESVLDFYFCFEFSHMIYLLDFCRIMNQYYLRKSNINRDIKSSAISVTNLELILFGTPNQHKYPNKFIDRHEKNVLLDNMNASEGHLKFMANNWF